MMLAPSTSSSQQNKTLRRRALSSRRTAASLTELLLLLHVVYPGYCFASLELVSNTMQFSLLPFLLFSQLQQVHRGTSEATAIPLDASGLLRRTSEQSLKFNLAALYTPRDLLGEVFQGLVLETY